MAQEEEKKAEDQNEKVEKETESSDAIDKKEEKTDLYLVSSKILN